MKRPRRSERTTRRSISLTVITSAYSVSLHLSLILNGTLKYINQSRIMPKSCLGRDVAEKIVVFHPRQLMTGIEAPVTGYLDFLNANANTAIRVRFYPRMDGSIRRLVLQLYYQNYLLFLGILYVSQKLVLKDVIKFFMEVID